MGSTRFNFAILLLLSFAIATAESNSTAPISAPAAAGPPKPNASGAAKILYLEQHVSDLRMERNRDNKFHFITISSAVSKGWDLLPSRTDVKLEQVRGNEICPVYFHIDLSEMERPNNLQVVDICLVKESGDFIESNVFSQGATVDVLGSSIKPSEFLNKQQIVTGYIHGQPNSLVSGYIVGGNFYGMVRLFDNLRSYHSEYYIEPISNAELYSQRFKCTKMESKSGGNAILFEFIPHEDVMDGTGCAAKADPASAAAAAPPKPGLNSTTVPVPAQNSTVTSKPDPKSPPAAVPPKADPNSAHEADDDDVAHIRPVTTGSGSSIFDLRFFDASICEICVWVQPNFAEKFGLGLNVERGTAEVISILKFANNIFRSLDFNDDGVSENIGLAIKSLVVTDEISVFSTGGAGVANNISRAINAITPKVGLKNMAASLNGKFGDCCATIGFIYQNMAPAITGSSVAGACTPNYNLGIVSGYTHTHKIGYFDVYRGVMHVLGHLFGGTHDIISEAACYKDQEPRTEFMNEYILHPVELLNLGMRPKSLSFSPCSKDEISKFLLSKSSSCLTPKTEPFCGNGITEPGEECDCGSIRDCRKKHECCGESDTVMGCKIIAAGRNWCFAIPVHE